MVKSNSVTDMLEKEPSWLIRWGITSVLSLTIILLLVSNIVSYPDINQARVQISSQTPPIPHLARSNGYIKKIFVSENDLVKDGDVLIELENNADLEQIRILNRWLDETNINSLKKVAENVVPDLSKLGDLQQLYNEALVLERQIKNYDKTMIYEKKINAAKIAYNRFSELLNIELNRKIIIEEEFELLKIEVDRNEEIYNAKVISNTEMNQFRRILLQKKQEVEQINSNVINIELKVNSTSEGIIDLCDSREKYEDNMLLEYNNKIKELKVAYQSWQDIYIINAKISGRVSFFKQLENGEFVSNSDHVLTIIPIANQHLFATGILPISNSGKVKIGQKVNIKLDDYSYREYGILRGRLVYISQIQSDGYYAIKIKIIHTSLVGRENDLKWFKSNMVASAEIITENVSLFQRFLFELKKIETLNE